LLSGGFLGGFFAGFVISNPAIHSPHQSWMKGILVVSYSSVHLQKFMSVKQKLNPKNLLSGRFLGGFWGFIGRIFYRVCHFQPCHSLTTSILDEGYSSCFLFFRAFSICLEKNNTFNFTKIVFTSRNIAHFD
jgi:hypothetical protein